MLISLIIYLLAYIVQVLFLGAQQDCKRKLKELLKMESFKDKENEKLLHYGSVTKKSGRGEKMQPRYLLLVSLIFELNFG